MKKINIMLIVMSFIINSLYAMEYRNKISMFNGFMSKDNEVGKSLGVEYESRFLPYIGLGGSLETVNSLYESNSNILNAIINLHPFYKSDCHFLSGLSFYGSLGSLTSGRYKNGDSKTILKHKISYNYYFNNIIISPYWEKSRISNDDIQTFGIQFGFSIRKNDEVKRR